MSTATEVRIKDLTNEEFAAKYSCDRFTASVVVNRLRYAVEHMSAGFLRQAFSPIIRDWYDFAATISGPPQLNYPMSVVSNGLVVFPGSMADAVANAVEEFGVENLSPGDVLICNDPVRGGRHVNDVLFIRPVFVDGEIVSFVNLCAHQLDMGGIVPGGFSATKTTVYENGLVIPPMLLWQRDKPVRSTFSLIFDNARMGELLKPDFMSMHQQLKLGERLILENIDKYGLDAFLGAQLYSCDTSAEQMRAAIESLPDGDYVGTALIDADGIDDSMEYLVRVTLRKRGHRVEADLSGTAAQARTSINAGMIDAKTAIGVGMTLLLGPQIPFTSGTWRDIDVAAPPGTLLTSRPPGGPTMLYYETISALVAAVVAALNPVLGEQGIGGDYGSNAVHNGFGVTEDGTPWQNVAVCGGEHGPWGGTRVGDGDSYTVLFINNNLDPATEQIEHDTPVVLLRKEHTIDTGGAGCHRGGAANRKDTLFLTDASHYTTPLRFKRPSGVEANNGSPGTNGAIWIYPPEHGPLPTEELIPVGSDSYARAIPVGGVVHPETYAPNSPRGKYFHFARESVWQTKAGAVFRYQTNGGGGWGDPFTRDPQAVLRDVRDEYVSIEGAARDYGVVVVGDPHFHPEALTVDNPATVHLRASR